MFYPKPAVSFCNTGSNITARVNTIKNKVTQFLWAKLTHFADLFQFTDANLHHLNASISLKWVEIGSWPFPSAAASALTLHITSMILKLYGSDKKAVDTNKDRSSVQYYAAKSDRLRMVAQINSFTTCTAHLKTVQTVTVMEKAANPQKCNKRKNTQNWTLADLFKGSPSFQRAVVI